MRICADDFFAIEFENQTQDTVSGRVLWAKVDRVVSDLALTRIVRVVGRSFGKRVLIFQRAGKARVDRNEASDVMVLDWSGKVS